MKLKKRLSLIVIFMTFVIGCSDQDAPTWSNDFAILFTESGEVGQSGALHGYLTKDGRLWLYKDDAEIQRLSHSVQLKGLSAEVLEACQDKYVTIFGTIAQTSPVIIDNIDPVLGGRVGCDWPEDQ
ncbi:hypothetical protein [Aliidiomarina sanyensis]|nr:hypothetical protein [Aliidiomarina sanyensis]